MFRGLNIQDEHNNNETRTALEGVANHIFLYSLITPDRCLELITEIRYLDNTLRNQRIDYDLPAEFPLIPIWLHLSSNGGDFFSAFSTADQLSRIATPIYTIAEGCVASGATILFLVGKKRYITPSSFLMIHELSSAMWGTHSAFKDEMRLQLMQMDLLVEFYQEHSLLEEDEIRKRLERDSWMNAKEALEFGFADEILK